MPDGPKMSRLDLNLLTALEALLHERSVTRAAQRLHLSQPALSVSLSRLRKHFDDPLLLRHGNSYRLTPLAERLASHTTFALEAARRVFENQADWKPESSTREFVIFGSDYAFSTTGKEVSRLAAEVAPGVRFRFQSFNTAIFEDAVNQLRSADGFLLPHGFLNDLEYIDLWSDGWVILADEHNRRATAPLDLQALSELPWVFTYFSRAAITTVGYQLRHIGIEPRIETVVENFLALPYFIVGTNRIGFTQTSLAVQAARIPGIRVLDPPFEPSPVANALWWHPVHTHDPEHAWMRSLFREAGEIISETLSSTVTPSATSAERAVR